MGHVSLPNGNYCIQLQAIQKEKGSGLMSRELKTNDEWFHQYNSEMLRLMRANRELKRALVIVLVSWLALFVVCIYNLVK
jgi:hypothetical protein